MEDKQGNTYIVQDGRKVPATFQLHKAGIDMKSALCIDRESRLPHLRGKWNGHDVSVLRDSGSDGVIVKRDLCKESDFIGGMGRCIFVDGSQVNAPMVRVHLDTPYFVGTVRALAMASPFFDVIIGNIDGARHVNEPDESWEGSGTSPGNETVPQQSEQIVSCHLMSSIGEASTSFNPHISCSSFDSSVQSTELSKVVLVHGHMGDHASLATDPGLDQLDQWDPCLDVLFREDSMSEDPKPDMAEVIDPRDHDSSDHVGSERYCACDQGNHSASDLVVRSGCSSCSSERRNRARRRA